MSLDSEMQEALASRHDVSALACMDGRAGIVLGMCAKEDVPSDAVEVAVMSAPQLCALPRLASSYDDGEIPCDESFVASTNWVHAFARVPKRPDLLVVGLARGGTNVALLRAWLREVAGRVGQSA